MKKSEDFIPVGINETGNLESIRENSAVCEVTGYDTGQITKDCLYAISKKLYAEKEALEQHLSVRTNELFDIQDKIILYDLTYSKLFIIPSLLLNLLFYNIIAQQLSE